MRLFYIEDCDETQVDPTTSLSKNIMKLKEWLISRIKGVAIVQLEPVKTRRMNFSTALDGQSGLIGEFTRPSCIEIYSKGIEVTIV